MIPPRRAAACIGAIGVALGAFGSHGLRSILEAHDAMRTWQTASFYHLLHSVVLLWLSSQTRFPRAVFILFTVGVFLFSGSLYVLSLTTFQWVGIFTPLGGTCIILGWLGLLRQPNA